MIAVCAMLGAQKMDTAGALKWLDQLIAARPPVDRPRQLKAFLTDDVKLAAQTAVIAVRRLGNNTRLTDAPEFCAPIFAKWREEGHESRRLESANRVRDRAVAHPQAAAG